jgi:hypothetical protein
VNKVPYTRKVYKVGIQENPSHLSCMASGPQTTTTAYGSEVKTSPMGTFVALVTLTLSRYLSEDSEGIFQMETSDWQTTIGGR